MKLEIPDELHLFEQKDRIQDIVNIQQENQLLILVNDINLIMYKCNEKFIIKSTDFFVQFAIIKFPLRNTYLAFESFHFDI